MRACVCVRARACGRACVLLRQGPDALGAQVLLNILADEIHRAHQRCMREECCDVEAQKMDFVFEAGAAAMRLMQGAYSCIALVKGVGLLAFRDPYGIRWGPGGGREDLVGEFPGLCMFPWHWVDLLGGGVGGL